VAKRRLKGSASVSTIESVAATATM
jgi:hypothetical protein